MEPSFPEFAEKWSVVRGQIGRTDYVNRDVKLAYVVTEAIAANCMFEAKMSEKAQKVYRGRWYRNVYVKDASSNDITFPDTADFRLLGVFPWGEKNLVVLANTKANNGNGTLRFTTLEQPRVSHEVNLPKGYRIPDIKKLRESLQKVEHCLVKLEEEKLLRLIVEKKEDSTRHHVVFLPESDGAIFSGKSFVQGMVVPVLYNLRALKPDQVLNKLGLVAIFAILVAFVFLRKS